MLRGHCTTYKMALPVTPTRRRLFSRPESPKRRSPSSQGRRPSPVLIWASLTLPPPSPYLYFMSKTVESSSSSSSSFNGAISTRSAGVVMMSYLRVFFTFLPDLEQAERKDTSPLLAPGPVALRHPPLPCLLSGAPGWPPLPSTNVTPPHEGEEVADKRRARLNPALQLSSTRALLRLAGKANQQGSPPTGFQRRKVPGSTAADFRATPSS